MATLAAVAAALLLYSQSAWAWGGLGHEAICELAFLELDATARRRVIGANITTGAHIDASPAASTRASAVRKPRASLQRRLWRAWTGLDETSMGPIPHR